MSDSLTSLISSEQPERFAHGRLFVFSDLSESLTVQLLIWFEQNEEMSDERMSEFPALAAIQVRCSVLQFSWSGLSGLTAQLTVYCTQQPGSTLHTVEFVDFLYRNEQKLLHSGQDKLL